MRSRRRSRRLWTLLSVLVGLALLAWLTRSSRQAPPNRGGEAGVLHQLMALEATENAADAGVWSKELLAQRCGRVVDEFWNAINSASNKWEVITSSEIGEVVLPVFALPVELPADIQVFNPSQDGRGPVLSVSAWRTWLQARASEGWQITQLELRQNHFAVDDGGRPQESIYGFRAHLTRQALTAPQQRASLEGDLRIAWQSAIDPDARPAIRSVDASALVLKTRAGPPPFHEIFSATILPPAKSHFIDPLILRDLDGDGRPEVILASANRVFRWQPENRFDSGPLCQTPPGAIFTAAIADFDGDGVDDFLSVKFEGFDLVSGNGQATFTNAPRRVWTAPERIRYGQVLACGDVDGDGDLDLWFGQYRNPYDGGQMPTPYFGANDGNPAYLLLNDGRGNFTDATQAAGLTAKRWRRTYAGSLVDLDGDQDLDLLVVSDFAGVDVFANDGRGRFTDVTPQRCAEPMAFGMAHTFADFDLDGRLDFFVTGMHCPTAQRLDALKLVRLERPDYSAMRPSMAGGNKLFLQGAEGRFSNRAAAAGVARSGWSWGCAAADFDNDGFPDLAVANGHETRQSVEEYEPQFWLHDIYVADSRENPVAAMYFAGKFARTRGAGMSYGGYEQNRLFLNRGGQSFSEVGHLLGVAMAEDSRNLLASDLDGDGRPDLVVTTFETWPAVRQTLRIFKNELPATNNWIAVRLRHAPGSRPALGATVVARLPDGRFQIKPLVTGDSHRAQAADTIHFGLGTQTRINAIEVRWAGGGTSTISNPAINQIHEVTAPALSQGATSRAR